MSCARHEGPSRWRVTYRASATMAYVFDCWAPTREGAWANTRAELRRRHPGIQARRYRITELRRGAAGR